jgi:hypothetical protein
VCVCEREREGGGRLTIESEICSGQLWRSLSDLVGDLRCSWVALGLLGPSSMVAGCWVAVDGEGGFGKWGEIL